MAQQQIQIVLFEEQKTQKEWVRKANRKQDWSK